MVVQNALRDLSELIRYHASVRPERVAINFEDRQTTFGQLDRRASRVANGLLASCPTPQARVAVAPRLTVEQHSGRGRVDKRRVHRAFRVTQPLHPITWRRAWTRSSNVATTRTVRSAVSSAGGTS